MKKAVFVFVVFLSFIFSGCAGVDSKVSLENTRIVFLGDSITNAGHYVTYMEYYLQKNNPQAKYDIISVGLASETVSGLSEKDHPFPRPCVHTRLDNILKATKPEILIACYGMNDGIYHPQVAERFQAYKDGYDNFIKKAKSYGVKKIVILTPPLYDSMPIHKRTIEKGSFSYKTPYVNYNNVLRDYSAYLKTLSISGVSVVDLNSAMVTYVKEKRKENEAFTLSRDGIHPGTEGHLLMAQTALKGIGYNFEFIKAENYKKIQSDPFYKIISKKRPLRSKGWLQFIGYTRGKKVKTDSVAEIENQVSELQSEADKLRK